MRYIKLLQTGLGAVILSALTTATAMEVSGVKVDESAVVSGVKLHLNGAGLFYKGPFKVYGGNLYASKKVHSLAELVAADGPKRLTMTFVRDVESALVSKLMTRGVEDNVPKGEMSKLVPGLIRMSEIFSQNKAFVVGDVVMLDWIPGTGMVITGRGKVQGEPFREPEFFHALMAIWLGPNPTYWKLKDEMLGIQ